MQATYIISAFILGLAGSLHCVGMCGPLMFSSILHKNDTSSSVFKWFTYHMGRIWVYAIWGMLFGFIGTSVKWFGWQQNISISLGIGILFTLLFMKFFPNAENLLQKLFPFKKIITKLTPKIQSSPMIGGILNGLLPCGLVYIALAGAVAMRNPIHGTIYMVFFGLGTLPMLLSVLMLGIKLQMPVRRYFTKWYPVLIAVMAILLILRGMNLGNFLSPSLTDGETPKIHCSIE